MGRFVYQPVPENDKKQARYGQLIINNENGHISVNCNGVVNSITREIENKFDDVNQIYYNLIEQDKVLYKSEQDYNYFIKYSLDPLFIEVVDKLSETKNCYNMFNNLAVNYNNIKSFITDLDTSLTNLTASTNSQYTNISKMKSLLMKIIQDNANMQTYISDEYNSLDNLRDALNAKIR